MKKFILIIIINFGLNILAFSQMPPGWYVSLATVDKNDTIPLVNLPEMEVSGDMSVEAIQRRLKYEKLKRDVKKVYPYAKLAGTKLNEINAHVVTLKKEREKRKYLKSEEKHVKEKFENEIKNLTITQGKILVKLIERETGSSSYDLLKEMRGSLKAFFWQTAASFFGADLKARYDPEGEDNQIESIVRGIESGIIPLN